MKDLLKGLLHGFNGMNLKLMVAIVLGNLLVHDACAQSSVQLSWSASTNASAAGYKIYYGKSSRTYTNSVDVGNALSATIQGLQPNKVYYFSVTAYNAGKTESGYSTEVVSSTPAAPFFNSQSYVSNSVESLQFAGGVNFGYYSTSNFPWVYHQDLGLVYYTAANDGKGGVYLKDSATATTWYTNPNVWPQLYDGVLKAWIYYYPDTTRPGHYTGNPRTFRHIASGRNFVK